MPDFKALCYLTGPNLVVSDQKNHRPGIDNGEPFLIMNQFSSRCCQHNHSHGWPYYSESRWGTTPDDGVCAASDGHVHLFRGIWVTEYLNGDAIVNWLDYAYLASHWGLVIPDTNEVTGDFNRDAHLSKPVS